MRLGLAALPLPAKHGMREYVDLNVQLREMPQEAMPAATKFHLHCRSAFALLALAIGGCVSSGPVWAPVPQAASTRPQPQVTQIPPTAPPPPPTKGFRPAPVMNVPGLEGVIGSPAEGLIRKFGSAQLDAREGDARKLQFSGSACVLDVYLYPPQSGATPVATHVEARRATDGAAVDRAACARALSGR